MKRSLALLLCVLVCACGAGNPYVTASGDPKPCAGGRGQWVQVTEVAPEEILEIRSTVQYVCNPRVADAGTACEDGRECRGDCVASTDALPGQETIGACAAYALRTLGSMTLVNGKAVYPLKLDYLENRQAALRLEYELAKARWDALQITTYQLKVERSCMWECGPVRGPNLVRVKDQRIRSVVYLGDAEDRVEPGTSVINSDATRYTVDNLFQIVHRVIANLTPDDLVTIRYDAEFGFPAFIENDDVEISHGYEMISVTEFYDRF